MSDSISAENERLRSEIARLREALGAYADKSKWRCGQCQEWAHPGQHDYSEFQCETNEGWAIAHAALNNTP